MTNVKVGTTIQQLINDNIKQSKPDNNFKVYWDDFGQMVYMEQPTPQKITIVTDEKGNITIYAA
jgi:hypothetical protein